jgi:hypothetical protein
VRREVGILDIGSTVLTKFKADTKDHRAGLKKLKGAEKDRAKAQLEAMEKENERIDGQIGRLGKVTTAVAGVAAAYVVLKQGFEKFAERQQMMAAGAGRSLMDLRKASMGLITDTKLLNIEANLRNATIGLNNKQMVQAVKMMLALRKQGVDMELAITEVTKAFVELNVGGLAQFGFFVEAATGSQDAMNKMFAEGSKQIAKFDGDLSIKGDNMKRTVNKLKNATDDMMVNFGKFANQVLPPVVAGLNMLLKGFLAVGNALGGILDLMRDVGNINLAKGVTLEDVLMYAPKKGFSFLKDIYSGIEATTGFIDKKMGWDRQEIEGPLKGAAKSIPFKKGQFAQETLDAVTLSNGLVFTYWTKTREGDNMVYQGPGGKIRVWAPTKKRKGKGKGKPGDPPDPIDEIITMAPLVPIPIMAPLDPTPVGGEFGLGPEGFDAMRKDWSTLDIGTLAVTRLTEAFNGMTDAAGHALGALITGTGSFGDVFKKMTGDILTAIAVEESVMALRETALAVGWFFTPGGQAIAAGHAESAALHLLAAGAAGAGARLFGSAGGAGAVPNMAGAAAGRGAGGGSRSQTIILGADFETDSARRRSHRLASILQQADIGGASVVEFG